jgi:hypothetical protein
MNIAFITTLAQHVDNDEKYNEREKQYIYSMARIFSYNLPVYGVVSEAHNNPEFKPKQLFPFEKLLEIESMDKNMTKSQKEFYSIKMLLNYIDLDDNTWIVKISGRYMIYNNSFIETLKTTSDNIKALVKTCDDGTQMYSFLFALRFKYFKDFFLNYHLPNDINLEKLILFYIEKELETPQISYVNSLGIFCNIADCNEFTYF